MMHRVKNRDYLHLGLIWLAKYRRGGKHNSAITIKGNDIKLANEVKGEISENVPTRIKRNIYLKLIIFFLTNLLAK